MKNIYLIPTDKPSRILQCLKVTELLDEEWLSPIGNVNRNIYITSDEEIKVNDWYIEQKSKFNPRKLISVMWGDGQYFKTFNQKGYKKIILTTDQSLDGVQAIDDEFLQWFIKNPSCEKIGVTFGCLEVRQCECDSNARCLKPGYEIIIPKEEPKDVVLGYKTSIVPQMLNLKEEPKQETLEEAAENYARNEFDATLKLISKYSFKDGAKWQAERMYSEKDMIEFMQFIVSQESLGNTGSVSVTTAKYYLEQFKKK